MRQFEELIKRDGIFSTKTVWKSDEGNFFTFNYCQFGYVLLLIDEINNFLF